MRPILLLAAIFAQTLGCLAGETMQFLRREIPWGQPVALQEFGGPQIEVSVRSRQISFISVDIADYTRMVPVVVRDQGIYGNSRVVMQPTRETRRIEKKNGVAVPGGRSDMFLLFLEPSTGIQVHFSDETAGQNRDVLIVGVPEKLRAPAAPEPAPKRDAQADGYLSDRLLNWYLRLEEQRDKLDMNDPEAVRRFNEEAARYHAEVKREREIAGAK